MVYGKYLLANNGLRLKVAFLLQAVVLFSSDPLALKARNCKKRSVCFLFKERNGKTYC